MRPSELFESRDVWGGATSQYSSHYKLLPESLTAGGEGRVSRGDQAGR